MGGHQGPPLCPLEEESSMHMAGSVQPGKLSVSDLLAEEQQEGGESIFFSLSHTLVLFVIYFRLEPSMSYYSLENGRSLN